MKIKKWLCVVSKVLIETLLLLFCFWSFKTYLLIFVVVVEDIFLSKDIDQIRHISHKSCVQTVGHQQLISNLIVSSLRKIALSRTYSQSGICTQYCIAFLTLIFFYVQTFGANIQLFLKLNQSSCINIYFHFIFHSFFTCNISPWKCEFTHFWSRILVSFLNHSFCATLKAYFNIGEVINFFLRSNLYL